MYGEAARKTLSWDGWKISHVGSVEMEKGSKGKENVEFKIYKARLIWSFPLHMFFCLRSIKTFIIHTKSNE